MRSARSGVPMIVLGGEQTPDAELMRLLHRADRGRRAGPPVPGRGRAGQPRAAARLCLRHRAADRRGLRPADPAAGLGPAGPRPARGRDSAARGSASCTTGRIRRPAIPAFVHALADAVQAQHGAVAVPIFCSSLRGAPADLLAQLGDLGRVGRHGAGGRRHQARPPRPPAATTRRGTSPRWPRWTSRSCRDSA